MRYASRIPISAIGNGSTLGTGAGSYWSDPGAETYLGARASSNNAGTLFAGNIYAVRLYSRQLTDDEIKVNQSLDHLRFENDLSDTMLVVSGAPEGIGSPAPWYGYICELSAGATRAVSCGEVPWKDATDGNKYSCVGWKLYDANGAVVGSGSGTSFTYTHPTPADYRWLEWQWRDTSTLGTFLLLR